MNCQSHLYRGRNPAEVSRRWFLQQCGVGLGAIALGSLFQQSGWAGPSLNPMLPKQPHFKPKAKRVIYLFQAGGPSHLELFDNKPQLAKFDGKLRFVVEQFEMTRPARLEQIDDALGLRLEVRLLRQHRVQRRPSPAALLKQTSQRDGSKTDTALLQKPAA